MAIFEDDPDAIAKLDAKILTLQAEHKKWKAVKKGPRTYKPNDPIDARWYMLPNLSANIRTVKKKRERILARQKSGKTLKRNVTYKKDQFGKSKPRFFYTEI